MVYLTKRLLQNMECPIIFADQAIFDFSPNKVPFVSNLPLRVLPVRLMYVKYNFFFDFSLSRTFFILNFFAAPLGVRGSGCRLYKHCNFTFRSFSSGREMVISLEFITKPRNSITCERLSPTSLDLSQTPNYCNRRVTVSRYI